MNRKSIELLKSTNDHRLCEKGVWGTSYCALISHVRNYAIVEYAYIRTYMHSSTCTHHLLYQSYIHGLKLLLRSSELQYVTFTYAGNTTGT